MALSIVAGANNAGKSNVIDAIRLFYGDLKWEDDRDAPKVSTSDEDSWVEIEFKPTESEISQLKDEYRTENGTFRVRNYFRGFGSDGKSRSGYFGYEAGVLANTPFYGSKNVGSGKLGKLVYIPAVSKVDDQTKLTGPSALRDLVTTVVSKVVANSPAYKVLKEAFTTFEGEIKTVESDDGLSLHALENAITGEIAGWDSRFELGIQSVQPDDIIKSLVHPTFIDDTHGKEIDQLRFGAGFQRHLVYTLIRLAAKNTIATKSESDTKKKEFLPELTWILFEEPEAFLHPSQEEILHDSLLALATDESTQVLLTTHSSRFVSRSMSDLTRLICVRRDKGVTSTYQVSEAELGTLFSSALIIDDSITPGLLKPEDVDQNAAMAALKMELWLQPNRAAAFFAQRVILVEGPSEAGLHSYLLTRKTMPVHARGVVVVDCMGKYNLHRFVGLLSTFGIDHSILYDGDEGKNYDAEVTAAIAEVRTSFTKRVTRLNKDLETELGIGSVEKRKKPQWVLYNLEAGLVEDSKLQALVEEFELLATK